jgi:Co/Zn/Cd efflux system component
MSIRTSTLITAALLGLVLNAGSIVQLHADHGHASVVAVGAVAS